jgi:hypothetical protein
MYLFTRSGRFRPGAVRESMAFVQAVTEKVRQESDLDVHAWLATLSPEAGTCTWAAWVSSLTELEAANDKLAVSDAFNDIVEKGSSLFIGPVTDGLSSLVAGELDPEAPVPAYVGVARAVASNGHVSGAVTAGVEIAEAASRISGVRTAFLVDATGPFGGCSWVTGHADIEALQASEEALQADDGWLALIDRVGGRYAPGASQAIYRRVS